MRNENRERQFLLKLLMTNYLACSAGWSHQHHLCWRPLSLRLNWTEAVDECDLVKGNLPTFQASTSLQFSVHHIWLNSSSHQEDILRKRREKTLDNEADVSNESVCPAISREKGFEQLPCCVKLHVICVKSARDE